MTHLFQCDPMLNHVIINVVILINAISNNINHVIPNLFRNLKITRFKNPTIAKNSRLQILTKIRSSPVRPRIKYVAGSEPVEGPFMVRQVDHERHHIQIEEIKWPNI